MNEPEPTPTEPDDREKIRQELMPVLQAVYESSEALWDSIMALHKLMRIQNLAVGLLAFSTALLSLHWLGVL